MPYVKFHENWEDRPSTATPVSAEAIEWIEEGIQDAQDGVDAISATFPLPASQVTIVDADDHYSTTTVEGALDEIGDDLAAHLADTSDAHDASAISLLDSANDFTATDVEGALAEIQTDVESLTAAVGAVTSSAQRVATIILSPVTDAVATGDGAAFFMVPAIMNGLNLIAVKAGHAVTGAGALNVQVRRRRSGSSVDMLSTALTVDTTEEDSSTAATAAVINTSNDDLATNDKIFIDVDGASAALGTMVTLTFGP